jgi:hypothetical protein
LQRFLCLLEFLDMGYEPAGLDREAEAGRGLTSPLLEYPLGGKAVEAGIDLYRAEMAGIVRKPLAGP